MRTCTPLAALELSHNDGPWDRPDDYRKANGVLRYSRGNARIGFSLTGMSYRAAWDATDQVPERATTSGLISRFGNLDATDGGDTYRHSLVFDIQRASGPASTRATAYVMGVGWNRRHPHAPRVAADGEDDDRSRVLGLGLGP